MTQARPVARARPWVYFAVWSLTGATGAACLVGILSIGLFVLPVALAATVLLARRWSSRSGLAGLVAGLALPLLYVALLNRSGPGLV
jgi:hypothetical protein